MMRPCPITLNGCPGADSPITNTSSEAPDPLLFAGVGWNPYDPWAPTILGNGPVVKIDCSNITWSELSQEMADLLAQINATICAPPDEPGGNPSAPTIPPNPNPFIPPFLWQPETWIEPPTSFETFQNDRQSACVTCPDGSVFCLALEAGTATATLDPAVGPAWVEYINAYLLAWLLQQIYNMRVCVTVPGLTDRTPPGIPPTPPPGPGAAPATFAAYPGWCCVNEPLAPELNTYNISGGSADTVWIFELTGGTLPAGTSLVQTGTQSALIQGIPTVAGQYDFSITATAGSASITINDSLHVLGITNADSLAGGTEGTPYGPEQINAAGGTSPYTFSGTAPAGLTLSTTGEVSGTPNSAGIFSFAVSVTDANGATCTQNVSLSISVPPCANPALTSWVTSTAGFNASVVPASPGGISDHFTAHIDNPANLNAVATCIGTINHNGGECIFAISGTLLKGVPADFTTIANLQVAIKIGSGPTTTYTLIDNVAFVPPGAIVWAAGPFSVQFTIPDTGGQNATAIITARLAWNFVGGYTYEIDGTITNV